MRGVNDGLMESRSSPRACAYQIKGLAKIGLPTETVGKQMGSGWTVSYLSYEDFQKALRKSRDNAIEECARMVEDRRWGVHTPLEEIAAAIRAQKGKP